MNSTNIPTQTQESRGFGAFLTRHRNLLLIVVTASALAVSSAVNRRRLEGERTTTSLPVTATQSAGAVTVYAQERQDAYLADVTALQAVCSDASLESRTREAAAARLTQLVADREAAKALETALQGSSLSPCAAVVSGTQVTIVTQNADFTAEDAAMALLLAEAHAGAKPSEVRIITGD
ncbi:MAG: SpoIIIAH-like family protein [Aristaeellaceae bacterium]